MTMFLSGILFTFINKIYQFSLKLFGLLKSILDNKGYACY